MPQWGWLLLGLLLLLGLRGKRGGGPPLPSAAMNGATVPSDRDQYIDLLWTLQQALLEAYRAAYDLDRLRAITRAASKFYGVPPEWVWGVMWGESKHTPVGIYGHDPAKAKAARSTAYGMSQILRGRFEASELPFLRKVWEAEGVKTGWTHRDLLDPAIAIWTTAGSFGRALWNRGGGLGRTAEENQAAIDRFKAEHGGLGVGWWWPQSEAGAVQKQAAIDKYGPDVYATGAGPSPYPSRGFSSPSDKLPPWKTGLVT